MTDDKTEFTVGSDVQITGKRTLGKILSGPNRKGEFLVGIGTITIWIPRENLIHRARSKKKNKKQARPRRSAAAEGHRMQMSRIDLHGLTAAQAIARLEEAIDHALRGVGGKIEVIHGLGTGTLKQAVHEYLAQSKHVSRFELDSCNKGTTWVYL